MENLIEKAQKKINELLKTESDYSKLHDLIIDTYFMKEHNRIKDILDIKIARLLLFHFLKAMIKIEGVLKNEKTDGDKLASIGKILDFYF